MATCSACGGDGVCKNGIHDTDGGIIDEVINETTGSLHPCPDCHEDCDNPGDCKECAGTGEVDD